MKVEVISQAAAPGGYENSKMNSNPTWAGVGAAGGAIAGAVIGALAGPVGAFLGLMACALAGGFAGKGVDEKSDLAVTESYLKEDHIPADPSVHNSGYHSDHAAAPLLRPQYQFPMRDRGRKYLEVSPGFVGRLREAQTFQSNLG